MSLSFLNLTTAVSDDEASALFQVNGEQVEFLRFLMILTDTPALPGHVHDLKPKQNRTRLLIFILLVYNCHFIYCANYPTTNQQFTIQHINNATSLPEQTRAFYTACLVNRNQELPPLRMTQPFNMVKIRNLRKQLYLHCLPYRGVFCVIVVFPFQREGRCI